VDGQLQNANVLASNIDGAPGHRARPDEQRPPADSGRRCRPQRHQSIHILSHGNQGDITLGNLHISQATWPPTPTPWPPSAPASRPTATS
jgi:hypothetical protein